MGNGRIHIFSGEGHGKSSAALGRAIQTACEGRDVVIIQFLKERGLLESEFVKRLEPEIKIFCFEKSEENFRNLSPGRRDEESQNILNGLNFAKKVMNTGECGLLILDEVLDLVENNIITIEELKNVLLCKPDGIDVIMTGTSMNDQVCTLADEVTKVETMRFRVQE